MPRACLSDPRPCSGRPRRVVVAVACAALWAVLMTAGCHGVQKTVSPSNFRDWTPEQAVLPYAESDGERVTVHNVRNCRYYAEDVFVVEYYDRTFDLSTIRGVDFFMVPFEAMPSLAHTMMSFEFAGLDGKPQYLAVSVETRKEKHEQYNPLKGSARQYELMYVVADEEDVVRQRTDFRGEDVYLYRSIATPQTARQLFVDVMSRVNELASQPEFYDTLVNNCTTNIVRHINRIRPNRIVYDMRLLLPGYSDELAYDEGLIIADGSFEETKRRARVNDLAARCRDGEDFSQAIRLR
jgi:hypothetical protein